MWEPGADEEPVERRCPEMGIGEDSTLVSLVPPALVPHPCRMVPFAAPAAPHLLAGGASGGPRLALGFP